MLKKIKHMHKVGGNFLTNVVPDDDNNLRVNPYGQQFTTFFAFAISLRKQHNQFMDSTDFDPRLFSACKLFEVIKNLQIIIIK